MNIKEIADMAGVSRYLNDGYVSEEKRERIRRVIEETGYQPSSQAQTLRTRKTKLVGVILPKINSDSVSRMVAGVHHMYNVLEAGLLSANGINTWMPIATAANVAQGGAALAIALKTRNKKLKSVALPSSLSAFMGITEPVIFGVNLRYMKPFIAGMIGGACGALVAGITGVGATAYGITGIFGYLITTDYVLSYTLIIVVAVAVAFVISWILFKDDADSKGEKQPEKAEAADGEKQAESSGSVKEEKRPASAEAEKTAQAVKIGKEAAHRDPNTVYSPLKGTAIPLAEVKDETFAGEILGKGMAVIPKEGVVKAPFDGEVTTFFETKHAVGLTSENGMEILIHVGINTVELKGQHYTAHVKEGDPVKAGQVLLTFDPDGIKKAGYDDVTTPVIVTNTDDYAQVKQEKTGETDFMEPVLTVSKE